MSLCEGCFSVWTLCLSSVLFSNKRRTSVLCRSQHCPGWYFTSSQLFRNWGFRCSRLVNWTVTSCCIHGALYSQTNTWLHLKFTSVKETHSDAEVCVCLCESERVVRVRRGRGCDCRAKRLLHCFQQPEQNTSVCSYFALFFFFMEWILVHELSSKITFVKMLLTSSFLLIGQESRSPAAQLKKKFNIQTPRVTETKCVIKRGFSHT